MLEIYVSGLAICQLHHSDTCLFQILLARSVYYKVEPVLSGHLWSETKMALRAGGHLVQVDYRENMITVTDGSGHLRQVAAWAGSTVVLLPS